MMQDRDNPRGLTAPQLGQLHALRRLFGPVVDAWLDTWRDTLPATIEQDDPADLARALGTVEGFVLALGEIVTPQQAKRFAALTRPLADALARHRGQ